MNKLSDETGIASTAEIVRLNTFRKVANDVYALSVREPFTFRSCQYTLINEHFKREKCVG